MEDYKNEISLAKKTIYWIIGLSLLGSTIGFFLTKAKEATHINDAVQNYEQFQEIYNTCVKLNTDLCNYKDLPENDVMFEQFSKAQRILAIKTQLNRWVEDYNAKSKMWGRSLWKSNALPYQLSTQDFNCN
jgi:CRISPR/Cas system CMR-associated protein Cmr5 small subunit